VFSVITDAPSNEVIAAVNGPTVGNRRVNPSVKLAGMHEGKNAIIVTVPDWAGTILATALRRMGAWFDRATPPGRVPTGRPIVSYAGASSIRRQDDRRSRKAARRAKAA
jgi:hypothetical protein